MEKIKVSIIIPVYNNSKYLRDCLNSVLKQTLDNIEIIAIDDYSTDDSFTILKEYQNKYPKKLKIIRNNKNMGVGYTRNLGISMSTGKYIGFVDGDDYINPKMYEDMYNNGEESGIYDYSNKKSNNSNYRCFTTIWICYINSIVFS